MGNILSMLLAWLGISPQALSPERSSVMIQCYGGPMDGAMVEESRVDSEGFLQRKIYFRNHQFDPSFSAPVFEWSEDFGSFTVFYERTARGLDFLEMTRIVL